MQKADDKPRWFFVDEAGDPAFYGDGKKVIVGTEGCSKAFAVGFLRTLDPQDIRSKLADVRLEISENNYFKNIPSVQKSLISFHAKDDCPEVKMLVFEALKKMDFGAQIVVGRKKILVFERYHKGSQDHFYDSLVSSLFVCQLHLATENTIVFSRRGSKPRQRSLRSAVESATQKFRKRYKCPHTTKIMVDTSQPIQEPVLQAADYVLWAVQRCFERGEMRYFDFIREKVELVWDIYDSEKLKQKGKVIYDRKKNQFDIKKASPLS